jgi:2,5-diketo-D-gluconate reductase A
MSKIAGGPHLTLNDGLLIPQVGYGVFKIDDAEAERTVADALEAGYRHIDTAAIYANERGVGAGIKHSGLKREDIFVTTKLWNTDQARGVSQAAIHKSLELLGLDYVDLYLIHWPSPWRETYLEAWEALIEMRDQGVVNSIGVSNFEEEHLTKIINETGVVPSVNQIELHPYLQQHQISAVDSELGILTEAWSPLGQGTLLENSVLISIANKHAVTVAQIIIRWHVQSGRVVIPKSVDPTRIRTNFDVFGFELDAEDLSLIENLNTDSRIGPDPMTAEF